MLAIIQDAAIRAAEGFREDPAVYFILVASAIIIAALCGVIVYQEKRYRELSKEKQDMLKAATEALTVLTSIVQQLKSDHRDGTRRLEDQLEKAVASIKEYINLLQKITP